MTSVATSQTGRIADPKQQPPGAARAKATSEQLRIARITQIAEGDDEAQHVRVKKVIELTQCSELEAHCSLHDCDNDVQLAVSRLLDGTYKKDEWQEQKGKRARRLNSDNHLVNDDRPDGVQPKSLLDGGGGGGRRMKHSSGGRPGGGRGEPPRLRARGGHRGGGGGDSAPSGRAGECSGGRAGGGGSDGTQRGDGEVVDCDERPNQQPSGRGRAVREASERRRPGGRGAAGGGGTRRGDRDTLEKIGSWTADSSSNTWNNNMARASRGRPTGAAGAKDSNVWDNAMAEQNMEQSVGGGGGRGRGGRPTVKENGHPPSVGAKENWSNENGGGGGGDDWDVEEKWANTPMVFTSSKRRSPPLDAAAFVGQPSAPTKADGQATGSHAPPPAAGYAMAVSSTTGAVTAASPFRGQSVAVSAILTQASPTATDSLRPTAAPSGSAASVITQQLKTELGIGDSRGSAYSVANQSSQLAKEKAVEFADSFGTANPASMDIQFGFMDSSGSNAHHLGGQRNGAPPPNSLYGASAAAKMDQSRQNGAVSSAVLSASYPGPGGGAPPFASSAPSQSLSSSAHYSPPGMTAAPPIASFAAVSSSATETCRRQEEQLSNNQQFALQSSVTQMAPSRTVTASAAKSQNLYGPQQQLPFNMNHYAAAAGAPYMVPQFDSQQQQFYMQLLAAQGALPYNFDLNALPAGVLQAAVSTTSSAVTSRDTPQHYMPSGMNDVQQKSLTGAARPSELAAGLPPPPGFTAPPNPSNHHAAAAQLIQAQQAQATPMGAPGFGGLYFSHTGPNSPYMSQYMVPTVSNGQPVLNNSASQLQKALYGAGGYDDVQASDFGRAANGYAAMGGSMGAQSGGAFHGRGAVDGAKSYGSAGGQSMPRVYDQKFVSGAAATPPPNLPQMAGFAAFQPAHPTLTGFPYAFQGGMLSPLGSTGLLTAGQNASKGSQGYNKGVWQPGN